MNFWSFRYFICAVLPTIESKFLYCKNVYLSSILKTTFMRLISVAVISPNILSTISFTIVALNTVKCTSDGLTHASVSSFFRLELTSKARIHLDSMISGPTFWSFADYYSMTIYKGKIFEGHCYLSCIATPNFVRSGKHLAAIALLG